MKKQLALPTQTELTPQMKFVELGVNSLDTVNLTLVHKMNGFFEWSCHVCKWHFVIVSQYEMISYGLNRCTWKQLWGWNKSSTSVWKKKRTQST